MSTYDEKNVSNGVNLIEEIVTSNIETIHKTNKKKRGIVTLAFESSNREKRHIVKKWSQSTGFSSNLISTVDVFLCDGWAYHEREYRETSSEFLTHQGSPKWIPDSDFNPFLYLDDSLNLKSIVGKWLSSSQEWEVVEDYLSRALEGIAGYEKPDLEVRWLDNEVSELQIQIPGINYEKMSLYFIETKPGQLEKGGYVPWF